MWLIYFMNEKKKPKKPLLKKYIHTQIYYINSQRRKTKIIGKKMKRNE